MSVNTLLNTKWQINAALQPPQGGIGPLDLQFSSNSTEYTNLELEDNQDNLDIYYNSTHVFDTNTWSNQNYRIIYIYGGTDVTDSDMIDWLEEYATQLDVSVKSVNADWLDANMRLASNAIRAKGGASSTISCPEGLSSAISNIPTGGGVNIAGTTDISAKAMENITAGDTIYLFNNLDKYFQITYPSNQMGTGYSVAWSNNGKLAVGQSSGSRIRIFGTTTIPFSEAGTPSISSGTINDLKWSPNSAYLAAAISASPYIRIYNGTGSYTAITNPSTLPAGNGYGCAWSADGTRLAVAHKNSPFVTIYNTSSTPYAKLDNPSTLPTGQGNGCAWSPDGTRLAVAHTTSPYITVYNTTTTPYTKLSNPATLPTGDGNDCAWSPDGKYLAVAHKTSPFVTIYDTSTTPYTKITNPNTLPTGTGEGCAWSPDGKYLGISCSVTSPFFRVYDTSSIPYTALTGPSNPQKGYAKKSAWSYDSKLFLVTASRGSETIVPYYVGGPAYYKASNKTYVNSDAKFGYSKTTTASGSTGTAVVVFSP